MLEFTVNDTMQCTTITAEVDNIVEDDDMVQLTLASSNDTIANVSMAAATVTVIDDSGMSVCVVLRDSQRCGPLFSIRLPPMHFSSCTLYTLHSTVPTIEFSESSYSVAEMDGQVEVCVNVTSTLERSVTVEVTTQDGGATGE